MSILKNTFFSILLAFTVSSFVYFSFANIYSSKILNFKDFQEQFHGGIYQYRILSGWFLIWIYDFFSGLNIDYEIFKFKFLNPKSEPQMYFAFYILNTFFLILSAVMMVLITARKNFLATDSEKLLITVAAIFTIALSQFVIVPYDVSSYFFLLAFFFFLIKYLDRNHPLNLLILVIIMAVSTLNRESSALLLSLAATLLYAKFGLKRQTLIAVAALGITFVAVYLGMRFINQSFATNDGNLLKENLTQYKNFMGMVFWMVFFALTIFLAKDKAAIKNIIIFHLLSLPYIAMCLYAGILYEARLYVPLFLGSIFLSKIHIK